MMRHTASFVKTLFFFNRWFTKAIQNTLLYYLVYSRSLEAQIESGIPLSFMLSKMMLRDVHTPPWWAEHIRREQRMFCHCSFIDELRLRNMKSNSQGHTARPSTASTWIHCHNRSLFKHKTILPVLFNFINHANKYVLNCNCSQLLSKVCVTGHSFSLHFTSSSAWSICNTWCVKKPLRSL